MTPYTRKLHQALIEIGKAVEKKERKKTPSMDDIQKLYDAFARAVERGDMKAMSVTSGELIASLVKWRIEKM